MAHAGGRAPTAEERGKERSFFYSNMADVGTNALLVLAALGSGSLTMLSEAIRSMLMLCASLYAYWVLIAVHRGRLTRFAYGVGKLEQLVWVVVGVALALSGLWVSQKVFAAVFHSGLPPSPFGLTAAAVVNSVNTLINILGWHAMYTASSGDRSGVYGAQLRARFTMMTSSLFLQTTLTVAALAKDDVVALVLDAVGAAFVAGLMLYNGISMIGRALPDLLDAPVAGDLATLIRRTVADVLPAEQTRSIRTRRSGRTTFVEVAVVESAFPSVVALCDVRAAITESLRREGAEVDLAVVPVPDQKAG